MVTKKQKLKQPSDYAVLSFRLTHEQRDAFERRIEKVRAAWEQASSHPMPRKNDVIIAALEIGLKRLETGRVKL